METNLNPHITLGQFLGLVEMLDWDGVDCASVIERMKELRRTYLAEKDQASRG